MSGIVLYKILIMQFFITLLDMVFIKRFITTLMNSTSKTLTLQLMEHYATDVPNNNNAPDTLMPNKTSSKHLIKTNLISWISARLKSRKVTRIRNPAEEDE